MSNIEEDNPPGYESTSKKRPRRMSEVWKHFEDLPDAQRAICKYCCRSFSAGSNMGTSHLKRHIETWHGLHEGGTNVSNQTPIVASVKEVVTCNIVGDSESGEGSVSNNRPKKRSEVWDHFQRTPDRQRAICEYCGQSFSSTKSSGTSSLKRHLERCKKRPMADINLPIRVTFGDEDKDYCLYEREYEEPQDRDYGFYRQENDEPHVKMAIMAEIPLLSSDSKKVWRRLVGPINFESEVCGYYQNEKMKLAVELNNLASRVTFTCEIMRAVEGYISITAYFINDDFKLVKMLIGVKKLRDSGIVAAIESCISDWKLEDKIFTFTLPPCLDQPGVFDILRAKYSSKMLLDGQYIHVPCCKTALVDFMEHCFYSSILEEGRKVKEFFETLISIPCRMSTFNNLATEMGFPPVSAIWLKKYAEDLDSVVRMLKDVVLYKDVFSRYVLSEIGRWHFTQTGPCCITWKQVELALQLSGSISDVINGCSSCQYPTPNFYFKSLLEIKAIISSLGKDISEIEVVREKETGEKNAFSLKDAIADQLDECNEVLFIACVLDPRFKLIFLEYCFEKIFESTRGKAKIYRIRECLGRFFDEYAQERTNTPFSLPKEATDIKIEAPNNSPHLCRTTIINEFSVFKQQFRKNRESELDEYLSEDVVDAGEANFNLLGWWKQNRLRYPVLARMARDILAVSTFGSDIGAEQEVDPRLVEAVICSKSWILSDVQSAVRESKS